MAGDATAVPRDALGGALPRAARPAGGRGVRRDRLPDGEALTHAGSDPRPADTGAGRHALYAAARRGAAGTLAGLVVYLLLQAGQGSMWVMPGLSQIAMPGILFGSLATCFLVGVEEATYGSPSRLILRSVLGMAMGGLLGMGYAILAHIYHDLLSFISGSELLRQAGAWAIFGLGTGLGAGIVAHGGRRAYHACAGGLVGGLVVGVVAPFPRLAAWDSSPELLLALPALGAAVGISTALAEHWLQEASLTHLSGSREGRRVLLTSDTVVLGRSELCDVPLLGDPRVESRHAELSLAGAPFIREVGEGGLLQIDGMPAAEGRLADGSVLQIGNHRLRFRCRGERIAAGATVPPPTARLFDHLAGAPPSDDGRDPGPAAATTGAPTERTLMGGTLPAVPAAVEAPTVADAPAEPPGDERYLVLCLCNGPSAGARIPLLSGAVSLGRGSENVVCVRDSRVSRRHALITPVQAGPGDPVWVISDLGSTNGTWLNGIRIRRAGLRPGDTLGIGDAMLRLEPPPRLPRTGQEQVSSGASPT